MNKVMTEGKVFEFKEAFEFIQFTSNHFYAIKNIQTGQIVAVIDSNIDEIYQKLYNITTKKIFGKAFQPSDSLPKDIKQYSHMASIFYNKAKQIHLKKLFEKESFKKAYKCIKDKDFHKILPKINPILLSDVMAMPNFYRYVIDVSSIIDMIESDVLTILEDDEDIINDVKSWFIFLYKYIMIKADCEFIQQKDSDILHLTALLELTENQPLLMIWRNGKRLQKFETISTFVFEIPNDDEAISIVNLILSQHDNLRINIYIKKLFEQLHTECVKVGRTKYITNKTVDCTIGVKVGHTYDGNVSDKSIYRRVDNCIKVDDCIEVD